VTRVAPASDLDPVIHQATRLRLVALLARNRELTFGAMREALGLTEGNLGAHLARLQEAGYVEARAVLAGVSFEQRWRLTAPGDEAWRAYLAALRDVLDAEAP
jgi:DNA-binding transcriptional ArsR family regulator